jgi:alpha-mannosidase
MLNKILPQIVGKYYLRIDPSGEGAKWRRSFGQEIYSPFLLAFTEQVKEKG